jgi:hypothetical protein
MGKYPSQDGLALHPYELGFTEPTTEQIQTPKCVEYHHIYHYGRYYEPESDGYGAWRSVFRDLVPNVVPLLIGEHNGLPASLHNRYKPPQIPKDIVMIDFVESQLAENGLILLHNHRRSQPPRMLTPRDWQAKKKRYKSGNAR